MTTTRERTQAADGDGAALVDALTRSAFAVMGVLTRIAAEHDMSLTQLRVFGILRDRRPRMAELADYLGLDKSTMSGLVDRAQRRGLLHRDRNADDGRAFDVYLSPEGARLAARVEAEIRTALAPLTRHLTAAQRRTLTGLLERMVG